MTAKINHHVFVTDYGYEATAPDFFGTEQDVREHIANRFGAACGGQEINPSRVKKVRGEYSICGFGFMVRVKKAK